MSTWLRVASGSWLLTLLIAAGCDAPPHEDAGPPDMGPPGSSPAPAPGAPGELGTFTAVAGIVGPAVAVGDEAGARWVVATTLPAGDDGLFRLTLAAVDEGGSLGAPVEIARDLDYLEAQLLTRCGDELWGAVVTSARGTLWIFRTSLDLARVATARFDTTDVTVNGALVEGTVSPDGWRLACSNDGAVLVVTSVNTFTIEVAGHPQLTVPGDHQPSWRVVRAGPLLDDGALVAVTNPFVSAGDLVAMPGGGILYEASTVAPTWFEGELLEPYTGLVLTADFATGTGVGVFARPASGARIAAGEIGGVLAIVTCGWFLGAPIDFGDGVVLAGSPDEEFCAVRLGGATFGWTFEGTHVGWIEIDADRIWLTGAVPGRAWDRAGSFVASFDPMTGARLQSAVWIERVGAAHVDALFRARGEGPCAGLDGVAARVVVSDPARTMLRYRNVLVDRSGRTCNDDVVTIEAPDLPNGAPWPELVVAGDGSCAGTRYLTTLGTGSGRLAMGPASERVVVPGGTHSDGFVTFAPERCAVAPRP